MGNSVGKGFSGAANGLLGIFGLGGFWHPVDKKKLNDAKAALAKAKTYWTQIIAQKRRKLTAEMIEYVQYLEEETADQEKVVDNYIEDQIKKNGLLITMLIFLVFFLILFDLF